MPGTWVPGTAAELRLIIGYIQRGSELLLQHASRIEELPRRPRGRPDS